MKEATLRALPLGRNYRGLLLATGLLAGLALVVSTANLHWQTGAAGLGFALAVLAGVVQRCST